MPAINRSLGKKTRHPTVSPRTSETKGVGVMLWRTREMSDSRFVPRLTNYLTAVTPNPKVHRLSKVSYKPISGNGWSNIIDPRLIEY